jgi:hypothetical protein
VANMDLHFVHVFFGQVIYLDLISKTPMYSSAMSMCLNESFSL